MPKSSVDFAWACNSTLKTFELTNCKELPSEIMTAITAQVGLMPNLISAIIENVTIEPRAEEKSKSMGIMRSMINKIMSKSQSP